MAGRCDCEMRGDLGRAATVACILQSLPPGLPASQWERPPSSRAAAARATLCMHALLLRSSLNPTPPSPVLLPLQPRVGADVLVVAPGGAGDVHRGACREGGASAARTPSAGAAEATPAALNRPQLGGLHVVRAMLRPGATSPPTPSQRGAPWGRNLAKKAVPTRSDPVPLRLCSVATRPSLTAAQSAPSSRSTVALRNDASPSAAQQSSGKAPGGGRGRVGARPPTHARGGSPRSLPIMTHGGAWLQWVSLLTYA